MTNTTSEMLTENICHNGLSFDPTYFKTAAGSLIQPVNPTVMSGMTTTVAELNQLHSQGAVTTDFAKLHALTATAAEVNMLHSQGCVAADFAKLHALGVVVPSAAAAHAHIVDLGTTATGTEIATCVNAVLVALETFGINASS